jgi:peptidoglycan/xylan/chitin deacetylase (PgdA/CDA1 family)
MKVAVRDDDTSFFTTPDALERVYEGVWDHVPVCLAVVPFAIGYEQPGIPREFWQSSEPMPLDRNPPLVAFLRGLVAARRATIALHGCTHQDFPGGYEFQAAPDPRERIARGRAYLESLLGCRIHVFVPPHNALSKAGLAAVSDAGLNLLGSFLSFRPSSRPWDRRTAANWLAVQRFRRATGRTRRDGFIYPFPLRYVRHAEFGCHSLVPGTTFDALRDRFEEARASGGDFCVATHYWEIDRSLKAVLDTFLDFAGRQPDVRFVAAEELFT